MLSRMIHEFGMDVYVYYFDISFEETLRRRKTKPDADGYSEDQLREWWVEKDLLGLKNETIFTDGQSQRQILDAIMNQITEF